MANIRNFDLNLLVALDALLDEQNVSRAARRLSLSQPTVSGMLNRLRDSFSDPLLVRTQHGMVPTPRAETLRPAIKKLLREAVSLLEPGGFNPAAADLTFSVSVNDYMQRTVLLSFIAFLRQTAPNIRIAVLPLEVERLASRMADGEIDLAVTTPEFAAPDLKKRTLRNDRYVCVARRDHPVRAKRASMKQFRAFGHVLVSPSGGSFSGPTDQALNKLGLKRRVVISVPNFLILPDLLETDDLIAVVPEPLARAWSGRLKSFQPPVEIRGFETIAVWHNRFQEDTAHRWLREALVKAAGGSRS